MLKNVILCLIVKLFFTNEDYHTKKQKKTLTVFDYWIKNYI